MELPTFPRCSSIMIPLMNTKTAQHTGFKCGICYKLLLNEE